LDALIVFSIDSINIFSLAMKYSQFEKHKNEYFQVIVDNLHLSVPLCRPVKNNSLFSNVLPTEREAKGVRQLTTPFGCWRHAIAISR